MSIKRYNKYQAVKTTVDGIVFPSKLQAKQYSDLKLRLNAGLIKNLQLEVPINIIVNAQKVCVYRADVIYEEDNKTIIEDAKGVRTPVFNLKWKLLQILYPQFEFRIYTGKVTSSRRRRRGKAKLAPK